MAALSNTQIRYLRGVAHGVKPVVMVAAKGLTETVMAELEIALDHHELVKVRISAEDRAARDALALEIAQRTKAETVQRIGNVLALFRRNRKKPKLALPE